MARRGGLLLWCLGSAFPTSSSCRGLDLLSRILCSWMVSHGLSRPGKLLLPGSCLLGPASSSCRGPCLECLIFSWRFLGGPRRRVLQLPVHKSGVLRYPYFSTPTVASLLICQVLAAVPLLVALPLRIDLAHDATHGEPCMKIN